MKKWTGFWGKYWKGICGILAYLAVCGCLYLFRLQQVKQASFSVAGVLMLPGFYWLLSVTRQKLPDAGEGKKRRRMIRYSAVFAVLFSLSMILGYQLQENGHTDYGAWGKAGILWETICLAIAVFPFFAMLFRGIDRLGWAGEARGKVWKSGAVFGVSAVVIACCLLPVWLAYYPIVMSYDFHRQVNEAVKGFIWFNPYQPLAHTWVIWCFVQLGYLFGNLQSGVAGMAVFQILLYALTAGYACAFLYRVSRRKWAVVAATLFFGVFPLNSVLVVCTTKDVLFGVLFLLFGLLLAERSFFAGGRKKVVIDVLLVLEGCVMVQFRNNAIYALAVYAVVWVIFAARKEKLRVLLLCVLLLAGGRGLGAAIKAALGTQIPPMKVEMYSVPIQQFGRVGWRYGEALSQEEKRIVDTYVPMADWPYYNPPIADSIKSSVGIERFPYTWEGHIAQLAQDWLTIGLSYPNEYVDAFLELTRGYWFLDDRSYAECLGWGEEGRMGILYTYNSAMLEDGRDILHETKFPWLEGQLEKIVSGNAFYHWPVLSLLFKAAFYCWALALVFAAFLFRGQKRQAVYCGFVLLYMATMLLGPVVQIRYVFPAMLMLPVLLGLLALPPADGEKGL